MSLIHQHIAFLRQRADNLRHMRENVGLPTHPSTLQQDERFQLSAVLLCSVHLDELEDKEREAFLL